jgi:hypothetical protein
LRAAAGRRSPAFALFEIRKTKNEKRKAKNETRKAKSETRKTKSEKRISIPKLLDEARSLPASH